MLVAKIAVGLMIHPLFHFVWSEVVLEDFHFRNVLNFENKFFHHQVRSSEVKSAEGPLRVTRKKFVGIIPRLSQ